MIADQVATVRAAIDAICPGVRILAAAKLQGERAIREAVDSGVDLVGENRAQELRSKASVLAGLGVPVHFIGHLQSNKINQVVPLVTCIQTIDSLDLARAVADRTDGLDVMIEVNTSGETAKWGVAPSGAARLARDVAALPTLRLTGFMTIGSRRDPAGSFALLRGIRDDVAASGGAGTAGAVELSMGMSGDYLAAVAEGATIVRLGKALFNVEQSSL